MMSGVLRPSRSANRPERVAPSSRSHNVAVDTARTLSSGTPNIPKLGIMINSGIGCVELQAKPHWSLVGCFHQGTALVSTRLADIGAPMSSIEDACS
jgi:hypothetical protein